MNYSVWLGLVMICLDTAIWYGLGFILEVALRHNLGKVNWCFRRKDIQTGDPESTGSTGSTGDSDF